MDAKVLYSRSTGTLYVLKSGGNLERLVIFGNSGSGKSTFAKAQSARLGCSHMDLDTVAWDTHADAPTRRSLAESASEIDCFVASAENWVVEGCYSDLLELAIAHATEIVFLNPGVEICVENARNRPWEPHKYSSPEAQDANLGMLIDWIRDYDQRSDEFSYSSHRQLYEKFQGKKREFKSNERNS